MDTIITQILNSSDMENFEKTRERYARFLEQINDTNKTPVRVFEPLSKTCLEQLEVVREVSAYLQLKKEEDARDAQEAALTAETKTETGTKPEASTEQTAK